MTRAAFLEVLAETRGTVKWELVGSNPDAPRGCAIRGDRGGRVWNDPAACCCPVTAVVEHLTGQRFRVHHYKSAARTIGFPFADAVAVALAADGWGLYDPEAGELHRELMTACGLEAAA